MKNKYIFVSLWFYDKFSIDCYLNDDIMDEETKLNWVEQILDCENEQT